MKTRTKTFTVTDYIAFDGVVFADENDCLAYEKKHKEEATEKINSKIYKTENVGEIDTWMRLAGCDDDMYAVRIDSLDDLNAINTWGKAGFDYFELIPESAIGTIQLLQEWGNEVHNLGTPEKLKVEYFEAIDNLCGNLINKTKEEKL